MGAGVRAGARAARPVATHVARPPDRRRAAHRVRNRGRGRSAAWFWRASRHAKASAARSVVRRVHAGSLRLRGAVGWRSPVSCPREQAVRAHQSICRDGRAVHADPLGCRAVLALTESGSRCSTLGSPASARAAGARPARAATARRGGMRLSPRPPRQAPLRCCRACSRRRAATASSSRRGARSRGCCSTTRRRRPWAWRSSAGGSCGCIEGTRTHASRCPCPGERQRDLGKIQGRGSLPGLVAPQWISRGSRARG